LSDCHSAREFLCSSVAITHAIRNLCNSQTGSVHSKLITMHTTSRVRVLGAWQLDQCLSDAGVFENKVSLSGAPWEVRLASRLLHERHASHLLLCS
jgi:hypothetical protein